MPTPREDEWYQAMRQADFTRAWQISDRIMAERLARGEPQHILPRHLQSVWNGDALAGRHVLVRCYHGLGDTVQYVRFTRQLHSIARSVSIWVQPSLQSLVASAQGVDRVLPLHEGVPGIDYDVDIEIMELAHALRTTPADLPGPVPYLSPRLRVREHSVRPQFTVGLVWSAGDWDCRRSIQLDALQPLLALRDIRFVSLQCGLAARQGAVANIADESSDDVDEFAARLHNLDLLISVDTFAAHLGGALGVPVWLMLHRECDWRWTNSGSTSIWYPTLRLFRQRRVGVWSDVVGDITRELERHA